MKLNLLKSKVKAQSITEYLIVVGAIMIFIMANTLGLSIGLRNNLNTTSTQTVPNTISQPTQRSYDPAADLSQLQKEYKDIDLAKLQEKFKNISSYLSTEQEIYKNIDTYGGADYTGGTDYENWVLKYPGSAYNAPPVGTILPDGGSTTTVTTTSTGN
jgi:hypothetical protein